MSDETITTFAPQVGDSELQLRQRGAGALAQIAEGISTLVGLEGNAPSMAANLASLLSAQSGTANTAMAAALRTGRAWLLTTGLMAPTNLLGHLRLLLSNPANSGRIVFLAALVAETNAGTLSWATIRVDPTGGLPTTVIGTPVNLQFGATGQTSATNVKADVSGTAMSGGSVMAPVAVLPTARTCFQEAVFSLAPGHSLGMDTAFTLTVGVTVQSQVLLYFWEETIN